ncbi:MAG TPA: hemerythrin domain-containing protein [Nitrospiraceae bacterium]|nr:hemerythrin domain-containing protein [Nitrospiraceae bacterium]
MHVDVFTLLRRDHEKVASLFKQIQRAFGQPDTPERHRLFQQLKRELELHAQVEDLHVYRVFQQAESTRDEAAEALEAHRNIKTLLDELGAARAYDHKWLPKFQDLQKHVERHVALEENEMFAKADAVLTPQEAEELGAKVEAAKNDISRDAPITEGGTPEET